mmetsp:Transcript_147812/g.375626  ORF Transcript_147812/g.375626 Transcript_147812/m.375626 type:complete len:113 (+) Transcript_147812:329-667(+)
MTLAALGGGAPRTLPPLLPTFKTLEKVNNLPAPAFAGGGWPGFATAAGVGAGLPAAFGGVLGDDLGRDAMGSPKPAGVCGAALEFGNAEDAEDMATGAMPSIAGVCGAARDG